MTIGGHVKDRVAIRHDPVRVFISSTFNDMHAERDVLVTVVFPELRDRLERIGLELFDVDLRWGIPQTGVDGERANSWAYCKQWIDRVEPFFICLIGQRYGWIPPDEEIQDPADRQAYAGLSITEMEIRHAVVGGRKPRSFFYQRAALVPPDAPTAIYRTYVDQSGARLEGLKSAITSTGRPMRMYQCRWTGTGFENLDEFGSAVLEDLWSGVLRDSRYISKDAWRAVLGGNPDAHPLYVNDSSPVPQEVWERIVAHARPAPVSPLDADVAEMMAFRSTRLRWFRGRVRQLQQLRAFVEEPRAETSPVYVVRAEPGAGKSALLAKLWDDLEGAPYITITHFVGATERSATVRELLERLILELNRHGVPRPQSGDWGSDVESLKQRLASRLESYDGRRVVLIIDGINQLTDGHDLSWLPHRLGPEVRVIVSCVDASPREESPEGRVVAAVERLGPRALQLMLGGLEEADVAEIVREYLLEYCKELEPAGQRAVCSMPQAKNPLYLLVVLHELRTLGGEGIHLRVGDIVGRLSTDHPDAVSLFDWMLQRLEVFGEDAARRWWSYIVLGRVGMSSQELVALLRHALGDEGGRAALKIERSVRRYLQRRGKQWDFFHGQLRRAVIRRYGSERAASYHGDIARLFQSLWQAGDRRAISELPHHQTQGESWDELEETLTSLRFVEAKCAGGMTYELVADYNAACAAMPEGRAEHEREMARDDAINRYTRDLIEYARAPRGHEKPEPPPLVSIVTDSELLTPTSSASVTASDRFARIREFAAFAATEAHWFEQFAELKGFCLQQALNGPVRGAVAQAAERSLESAELKAMLFLRREDQRPPSSALRGISTIRDKPILTIGQAALTPDGHRLATVVQATIRIWDLRTGACERTVGLPSWAIARIAITPDCRTAVLGGSEGDIHFANLETGSVSTLKGHSGSLAAAVAVTADGSLAVSSAQADAAVRVWDVIGGQCLHELGHDSTVLSVAITPDGRRVVCGCMDGTLRVWDPRQGNCLAVLTGSPAIAINCLAISADGSRVIAGCGSFMTVWDLTSSTCVQTLGQLLDVVSLAVTPTADRVVCGGINGTLQVWDITPASCRRTLRNPYVSFYGVGITADGSRVVSIDNDRRVRVWDLQSPAAEPSPVDAQHVWLVHTSPDDRGGLPTHEERSHREAVSSPWIGFWRSVFIRPDVPLNASFTSNDAVLTSDQTRLLLCSSRKELSVHDVRTGASEQLHGDAEHEQFNPLGHSIFSLAVSPHGRTAFSGRHNGTIQVWDLDTHTFVRTLRGHVGAVFGLGVCPDGRTLLSGGSDRTVRLWNVSTGTCVRVLEGHYGNVYGVVATPDGKHAVSAASDSLLMIWDLSTGALLHEFSGHDDDVTCVVVAKDGRHVLSGSVDGTVRVWDLTRRDCVAVYPCIRTVSRASVLSAGEMLFGCGERSALGQANELLLLHIAASAFKDGGRRPVTATRFWIPSSSGQEGRWRDPLAIYCPWCDRLIDFVEWKPGPVTCPYQGCDGALEVTPFTCDPLA